MCRECRRSVRETRGCRAGDCPRRHFLNDLCSMHHQRWRRLGSLAALPDYLPRPCSRCGEVIPLACKRGAVHCVTCQPVALAERMARRDAKRISRNRVWIGRVIARDGWDCHLCSEPVDRRILWPDPRSASADHVVPKSLGGSDDLDNLKLAHLVCNVKRGNRLLEV